MSIALLVMTDGRYDHLLRSEVSMADNLFGDITEYWMHDDSGAEDYRRRLRPDMSYFRVIGEGDRRGFGGAIRYAWQQLAQLSEADYVFHLEDDFIFNRSVNLADMVAVLDANPHLTQMALKRQAVNAIEIAAGGVVESTPDSYVERFDGLDHWLEHRLFFTTNPSLYRKELIEVGWPEGAESEGRFAAELFTDPQVRCGYWGSRDSEPWVTHIGKDRVGHGY